jgi:hypothetical protein
LQDCKSRIEQERKNLKDFQVSLAIVQVKKSILNFGVHI